VPNLNFFTPLLDQEKKSIKQYQGLIVLLVFFLSVAVYLVLQGQIYLLEKNLVEQEQTLADIKTVEFNDIMEIKSKIVQQKSYLTMAKSLEQEFENADFIKLGLIEEIIDNVPPNLFFQNLTMKRDEWQLTGYADKRETIAEFQYNLKKCEFFEEVHIASINIKPVENIGDTFGFSMKGTFNLGVIGHEN